LGYLGSGGANHAAAIRREPLEDDLYLPSCFFCKMSWACGAPARGGVWLAKLSTPVLAPPRQPSL
jgi:hypothetical protein